MVKNEDYINVWKNYSILWKDIFKAANKAYGSINLTVLEFKVLDNLSELGPTTMIDLASLLSVTQAWVTSLTDRLEERGLVIRERSSSDRRVIFVNLTDSGRVLHEKGKAIQKKTMEEIFGVLNSSELKTFDASINKIRSKLEKNEDKQSQTQPSA
ncbi:MAG: MarR family winged helix-turn-helix transcriptional regulator [Thermoplasmata archaeon]